MVLDKEEEEEEEEGRRSGKRVAAQFCARSMGAFTQSRRTTFISIKQLQPEPFLRQIIKRNPSLRQTLERTARMVSFRIPPP